MAVFRFCFFILGLCISLTFSGCGNQNIKTGGSVSFTDGSPVTSGFVRFETPQNQYVGMIQSDGTFKMNMGKGLPSGQYQVSLFDVRENDILLLDEKYENPDTSGIIFEVKSSANEPFKITVERSKIIRSIKEQ
jgi:hypothetical protein